jgi:hypothetical protein
MRLIELRGPDAAETHEAWAPRLRRLGTRLKRAARALRLVFRPLSRRRGRRPAAGVLRRSRRARRALYVDGRLSAQLDGIRRL